MNLAVAIAVYATMSKELGLPLRFPGKPGAWDKLLEMTDAGLLARATVWAATDPRFANQAFNINNGDLFRWNDMWPSDVIMADKAPLRDQIVARYGLESTPYTDVSSWRFADFVFSWDYDMFGDGSRARRFGFHEFIDTEAMFFGIFDDLKRRKIIPT
jgi:hypothetical protein